MKKQKIKESKKRNEQGITLIALVLTIIVLLILAGVALSLALGQNGLVFKAKESKQKQEIAQEKDRIMTAYGASFDKGKFNKAIFKEELKNQGVNFDDEIVGDENATPLNLKLKTKHDEYTVTYTIDDGRIETKSIGQNHLAKSEIQVGDTIIYDPTKGVTDTSKLTYTSPKGTAKTGGNGYADQTITIDPTAKEWIVISTHNNQIKVMAKEPVGDYNQQLTLQGGIAWLYAEEELHKACSIYGHGKGAKKTTTTYQIGNPYIGEAKTRTLTDSAARSMTMEDIVHIMKGESYTDFTDKEKNDFNDQHNYKAESQKSPEALYPTISSMQESGESTTKQRYEHEWYYISKNNYYDKDLVEDAEVKANKRKLKEHIFKHKSYWLGSRYVTANYSGAYFCIRLIDHEAVFGYDTFDFNAIKSKVSCDYPDLRFLRPVVILDSNADIVETSSGSGVWEIK
ncbi:MAG: type II secretion system protein [Clostridium sp.]